ncbi:MAG: cupin domain-containing protein [Snodgrassella sp.]|uniref:cupin domain-containing protein n=1 Tax=Snodgrassella TaxID=1193515 RepID=UPI000815EC4B|nr:MULTISPECIES: cupin domain-containing protein [Snodgrassella]MCO6508621.1 cupin domain-containing protein [Snodgrassella sp.]SCB94324.1 Cupin domain protein [Snodgrassella sp. R-53583]
MSLAFKQIFPQGTVNCNFAQYFIGQSYLCNLAAMDGNVDVDVSNVTFEPGCHNHWHKHQHGYQILLATAGQGWYQEAGKPARLLNPGDVVVIHAGVKHWHGATKDSWFSHIAITKGQSEWLEPVTSSDYNAL